LYFVLTLFDIFVFSFLETSVPLLVLIEAARAGNEKEVEEYALVFTEHANKLVEVFILGYLLLKNKSYYE
jgi:catenin alpha